GEDSTNLKDSDRDTNVIIICHQYKQDQDKTIDKKENQTVAILGEGEILSRQETPS
ncbi:hypothetical protein J1N35_000950, partial [Gossypium stocksii]